MTEQEVNRLIYLMGNILTVFMIIPIIPAIINKNRFNISLKLFYYFCLIAFIIALFHESFIWIVSNYTEFWMPYLDKWNIHDTNFLGIFAYLNNFIILGFYFSTVITNSNVATSIKWISIILSIYAIINYLFIEGFRVYGIFNPTASSIFCFLMPLIHFWYLYKEDSKVPLNKNPYFWIALGLLIPNIVGLFFHFTGNKIYGTDFILFCKISITRSLIGMFGQILFAIGFYYAKYTKYMPKATA